MGEGATLVVPSNVDLESCRRRKMLVACAPSMPGTWVPGVHSSCIHNEYSALLLRSLACVPGGFNKEPSRSFVRTIAHLKSLAKRFCQPRWTYEQTAQTYQGRLRRRYNKACLDLEEPWCRRDFELRAFLKAEKCGAAKDSKPRMIFPRSPKYNLALASFLKPFEHWLWGYLTAYRCFGGSKTRVVAKGLSPRERANLIQKKMNLMDDCVCFEVDGKAFEAHVSSRQVSLEHSIYLAVYGNDPELAMLLSRQLFTGRTAGGVKFSRPGGRASGDYNTGMGNSLLMLCAVISAMKHFKVKFDTLVDGDNALLFVEASDIQRVYQGFGARVFDDCGHEMTLEKPVTIVEHVRFGRSAPVFLGPGLGYTMVREPWSVLSTMCASHRWLNEPTFGRRWLGGVAMCELSLARGIPVTQAFAFQLFKWADVPLSRVPDWALVDYFVVGARLTETVRTIEPTRECRLSYERAFGLSPDEQVLRERLPVSFGFPGLPLEMPVPSRWFEAEAGLYETFLDGQL